MHTIQTKQQQLKRKLPFSFHFVKKKIPIQNKKQPQKKKNACLKKGTSFLCNSEPADPKDQNPFFVFVYCPKKMELQRSTALKVLLGFLVVSLIASSSLGRFVVEKNSLMVTSPDSIKGKHDSAIGNFGIPQYGGSMAGTVVYPKENRKGCKSFDGFGISFQAKPGALPTFVLVDRGGTIFFFFWWFDSNSVGLFELMWWYPFGDLD